RPGAAPVAGHQRFSQNVLTFAVAYGLALQGLKKSRLQTNLLPQEIRREREVRAKKPFAAAAAACLLVGVAWLAGGYGAVLTGYSAGEGDNAGKKATTVAEKVKRAESTFQTAKTSAEREEGAVKSIIAGQDEQENWLALDAFIRSCLPQADGSNLPAPSKRSDGDFD